MPTTDKTDKLPTKWDLTPLLSGDNDPQIETKKQKISEATQTFVTKWKDRTDYMEKPEILREALDEYEEWSHYYGTDGELGYYFSLRSTQEENNPDIKAKLNLVEQFSRAQWNEIQFFHLNIAKIGTDRQQQFLGHDSLRRYRHFLSRIFAESRFLLSEKEERILNLKSVPSYMNWVQMTSSFLSKEERPVLNEKGKKEKKSFTEIINLMNDPSKHVRDSAAAAFNDILKQHIEVGEAELNAILTNKKIDDELRGVPRPDMTRHLADDIDSGVVDSLIDAVAGRFDISTRYYALKAKLMGVEKLAYHERNVEYGSLDKKVTYEEAVDMVYTVFFHLDAEFAEIFKSFTEKGQIDVYPAKGKRSGAFCAHQLLTQPTYVFLNHTDRLNDVLTLAHEMGHAINNELMRKSLHALDFGSPLSTAEVASTFMEDFVIEHIAQKADDELRLSILMKKLNDDISTIFRQVALYRFEQKLHANHRQKGYLSKEDIGTLFSEHMHAYMGDAVESSAGCENWWLYWSHIRSFFYVYSYASGLLISKSLQSSVRKDPAFITNVKTFLAAGTSDSPANIFKGLGIDIADKEFWGKGLAETEALLKEAEYLAKKLGKVQ